MQLEVWQLAILAVVQGITEFLPVSSSGHLVILGAMLGVSESESNDLNIVLHLGTLASILVFYWQRVVSLIREDRRIAWLVIIGTLPAAVIGIPLKKFGEPILASPLLAGCLLVVTGIMILVASKLAQGKQRYQELSVRQTLLIGCAQAVAVLPGLSRSGSTICAGLKLGLSASSAATFSFLLAIPAIGGAGLLEVLDLMENAEYQTPASMLGLGALIAFGVGLLSLWWLVRWLERGRFQLFAAWCIPLGIAIVIWQLALK